MWPFHTSLKDEDLYAKWLLCSSFSKFFSIACTWNCIWTVTHIIVVAHTHDGCFTASDDVTTCVWDTVVKYHSNYTLVQKIYTTNIQTWPSLNNIKLLFLNINCVKYNKEQHWMQCLYRFLTVISRCKIDLGSAYVYIILYPLWCFHM